MVRNANIQAATIPKMYMMILGQQLSICPNTGHTCCNNKMERRYIQKVNTDLSNVVDRLFEDMKERFIYFSQIYKGILF